MAKKEAVLAPETIAAKSAAKVAMEIFKTNADINVVHVTSDGTPFFGRNDAENHAKNLNLKNRDVYTYRRGGIATSSRNKKSTVTKQPEEAETEVDELTGAPIDAPGTDKDDNGVNTTE